MDLIVSGTRLHLRNVPKAQPFQEVGLFCGQGRVVVLNLFCSSFAILLYFLLCVLCVSGDGFVGVGVGFMEVQGRAKGERLVAELADKPVELADTASEVCLTPDLCNVRKLLAGEVDEGQVIEAGGDGGVVLDERAATGVLGKELMDARVVTQQTAVSSERKAAGITPEGGVRMRVHVSIQIQSGAAGLEADGTRQKLLLRASARRRLLGRRILHHLLGGRLLSVLLLEALPPLHGWTAAFGGGGGADGEQTAGRVLLVDLHVSVHVAVGGEGLAADVAFVGPLAAVDQHVSVERRGRAQALPADAAGVVRRSGVGVVLSDVHGQLMLCLTALVTQWTKISRAVVFGVLVASCVAAGRGSHGRREGLAR